MSKLEPVLHEQSLYQCACGNHRRLKCINKVTESKEFWALRLSVAQNLASVYALIIMCVLNM